MSFRGGVVALYFRGPASGTWYDWVLFFSFPVIVAVVFWREDRTAEA